MNNKTICNTQITVIENILVHWFKVQMSIVTNKTCIDRFIYRILILHMTLSLLKVTAIQALTCGQLPVVIYIL